MNDKQFKELTKKLDKIYGMLAIQGIEDKDSKVYALKKLGFTSAEIAPLVGLTESGIRDNRGWKKK